MIIDIPLETTTKQQCHAAGSYAESHWALSAGRHLRSICSTYDVVKHTFVKDNRWSNAVDQQEWQVGRVV